MILGLYRALTGLSGPLLERMIDKRLARGKEDPDRVDERKGLPSLERPAGRLIWVHAASVGESISSLALINALLDREPGLTVLQTTGTVTSARLMRDRLPTGAIHQFVPVDHPKWVKRFLDHWRPDMALWMESELWPNLLGQTQARGIPTALVNARLSDRSFDRWRKLPALSRTLLSGFAEILAQSERDRQKYETLGFPRARHPGNLKFAASPQAADETELAALTSLLDGRQRWLAASTHAGEEELITEAHLRLRDRYPGLLLVLVPRHPERGDRIQAMMEAKGLHVARRSRGELPSTDTDIYLADTLGEMGMLYRMADISLVGGSLVEGIGGHNPLEPAQLGSCVLFGSHMANCQDLATDMLRHQAAYQVSNGQDIIQRVDCLLSEPEQMALARTRARDFVRQEALVVDRILDCLAPHLDREQGSA